MNEEKLEYYEVWSELFENFPEELKSKLCSEPPERLDEFTCFIEEFSGIKEDKKKYLQGFARYPNEDIKFFSEALLQDWDFSTVVRQILLNIVKDFIKSKK